MWRTHLAFGIFLGLVLYNFINIEMSVYLFVVLVGFSSLIVDIDHPDSKVGRKVKPLSYLTNFFLGHRGMMHSLIPVIVVFVFALVLGYFEIGLALGLGYLSHLIADMLTLEGINFFYPVKSRVSGFIRTGSFLESLLFILLVVLICVMILY